MLANYGTIDKERNKIRIQGTLGEIKRQEEKIHHAVSGFVAKQVLLNKQNIFF